MLINLREKKQLTKILLDTLVILCCFISIGLSIIESRLNTDAHHWGLMYVNAADLNQGLIPYKEIFIQYGFLTTLIQIFLTASPQRKNRDLLTGVFLGLCFLARQSLLPILAPIYLYLLLIYVSSDQELRKVHLRDITMFHLGMLSIIGAFLLYLVKESAFRDWINQSFTILSFYKYAFGSGKIIILKFLFNLINGLSYPNRDLRLLLYSVVFFNALTLWIIVFLKGLRKKVVEREKLLFLFSSVVLFGYLQSLHIYEVFRLQNPDEEKFVCVWSPEY